MLAFAIAGAVLAGCVADLPAEDEARAESADALAAAGDGQPHAHGPLGFIGDSLTYQYGSGEVLKSLTAAGWPAATTRVDGVTGRSINGPGGGKPLTQAVIASWRAAGFDPPTWCIALGANNLTDSDAQWTAKIDNILDVIAAGGGTYRVYWPGITFRPDINTGSEAGVARRFFQVLTTIAAKRNVAGSHITLVPIDFDALMHNGRDETVPNFWVLTDATGRHMYKHGYVIARNPILVNALAP